MTDRNELVILTPEQQVAAILTRDARRVQRLTWLVAGLWAVTALLTGLLGAVFYNTASEAHDVRSTFMRELASLRELASVPSLNFTLERTALSGITRVQARQAVALELMAAAIGLLALSALVTVVLVHATRRATLRQIQAGLADISKQLAELRQKAGPPPVGGSHQGS